MDEEDIQDNVSMSDGIRTVSSPNTREVIRYDQSFTQHYSLEAAVFAAPKPANGQRFIRFTPRYSQNNACLVLLSWLSCLNHTSKHF